MIRHIDHVNIVVDDLAAMTAFYRDLIGLRVTREVAIRGDWIDATTGLAGVEADVVYLEAQSGPPLELIAYRRPLPESPRPAGLEKPNTRGLRHLAFRVDDIETLVASLEAAGVKLVSGLQKVPTGQVEFDARQKWIVYCHDPEGNLLELCDYR